MSSIENQDILISVIVPCYNVEKYLKRCMDSILRQTYRNLEIILVDDGSTDRTGKMCDKYALKDNRIKVVHKENGGLSTARNTGIEYSTGEYISFCDSDDWIELDTYEYLMELLKKYNPECVVGRTCDVYTVRDHLEFHRKPEEPVKVITTTEVMKLVLLNGSGVNNRLFKREIFDSIRFPVGITNEDEAVIMKIYAMCKTIAMGGKQTYYYRKRANSITTVTFSLKNLDWYENTKRNIKYIRKERPELLEYAYARHYKAAIHCGAYLHLYRLGDEGRNYRIKIRRELRHNFFKCLKNKHLPIKYKLVGVACSIV